MTEIEATDPGCPSYETRCYPEGSVWVCRTCGISVLALDQPE